MTTSFAVKPEEKIIQLVDGPAEGQVHEAETPAMLGETLYVETAGPTGFNPPTDFVDGQPISVVYGDDGRVVSGFEYSEYTVRGFLPGGRRLGFYSRKISKIDFLKATRTADTDTRRMD